MWKQLFAIFNKDTLLDRAFQQSYEMLDTTREMFLEAKSNLREKDHNKLNLDIYTQDRKVNKFEREVRRNVLKHISVAGADDIYSCMVLVSIIIDIERIGDYTKNIVDLARNHPAKLEGGLYKEDLLKVEHTIEDTFLRVTNQLKTSDAVDAEKLLLDYEWVIQICDQHVNDYITEVDKTVSSGDAVTLALYYRFIKRINSHLRNIATSVVNPFDQIGFTHKLKKEAEQ
jgi:phosphate transport system protein